MKRKMNSDIKVESSEEWKGKGGKDEGKDEETK